MLLFFELDDWKGGSSFAVSGAMGVSKIKLKIIYVIIIFKNKVKIGILCL